MRVFNIKTGKGNFVTHSVDDAEKAVSRDDLISIARTEMTKEEYLKISSTPESSDFFNGHDK
jgi:hypothetical protein